MLLKMFGLLMAVTLIFSALTFAFFWFETASSAHRAYLDRLFGGRTGRALFRLVVSSAMSMVLVVLFSPLAFWRRLWSGEPDHACPMPPVIFVHGLYHNASAWLLYRWWLKRAGFHNVYAFTYNSWKYSFGDLLEQLDHHVSKVAGVYEGRQLMLVGHSLGGLLSRAYVECSDSAGKVKAVVALGAPHHGSKLAALGLGGLAQSLLYRGPLIERLEKDFRGTAVPRLAVYSPVDNMVLPNEALRAPEGWELQESRPVGHVGMLYHRPTADLVVDFLRRHSTGKSSVQE